MEMRKTVYFLNGTLNGTECACVKMSCWTAVVRVNF